MTTFAAAIAAAIAAALAAASESAGSSSACVTASAEHNKLLSSLPPVPCREDLARVAETYFRTRELSRAAEIGVWRGTFAAANLRIWGGEYFAIDAWRHRSEDARKGYTDKNERDQSRHDTNFAIARRNMLRVDPHERRFRMLRNLSFEAATLFPDHHFDWLYVDALHTMHLSFFLHANVRTLPLRDARKRVFLRLCARASF